MKPIGSGVKSKHKVQLRENFTLQFHVGLIYPALSPPPERYSSSVQNRFLLFVKATYLYRGGGSLQVGFVLLERTVGLIRRARSPLDLGKKFRSPGHDPYPSWTKILITGARSLSARGKILTADT